MPWAKGRRVCTPCFEPILTFLHQSDQGDKKGSRESCGAEFQETCDLCETLDAKFYLHELSPIGVIAFMDP